MTNDKKHGLVDRGWGLGINVGTVLQAGQNSDPRRLHVYGYQLLSALPWIPYGCFDSPCFAAVQAACQGAAPLVSSGRMDEFPGFPRGNRRRCDAAICTPRLAMRPLALQRHLLQKSDLHESLPYQLALGRSEALVRFGEKTAADAHVRERAFQPAQITRIRRADPINPLP